MRISRLRFIFRKYYITMETPEIKSYFCLLLRQSNKTIISVAIKTTMSCSEIEVTCLMLNDHFLFRSNGEVKCTIEFIIKKNIIF